MAALSTTWTKSSRSGQNGQCVEARIHQGRVEVRDSKNPTGEIIAVSRDQWRAFVEGLH